MLVDLPPSTRAISKKNREGIAPYRLLAFLIFLDNEYFLEKDPETRIVVAQTNKLADNLLHVGRETFYKYLNTLVMWQLVEVLEQGRGWIKLRIAEGFKLSEDKIDRIAIKRYREGIRVGGLPANRRTKDSKG